MQTVILGDEISFNVSYVDSVGDPYDPDEVVLKIVRNATQLVYGPFFYPDGDITHDAVGSFSFTLTVPTVVTPGMYAARWDATVEGDPDVQLETFQIIDPPVEPSTKLDQPRVYGIIRESPLYQTIGMSGTDRIFLIGHANGIGLNDPYQVVNMQEAVNLLQADSESPLLRALLEVYNAGCRDMWLVASAPMTEYVPNLDDRFVARAEWGGLNFYERYYERLESTYAELTNWDLAEVVLPVEAPFYDAGDVDFLTQLVFHCAYTFERTSSPVLGIIGTRIKDWEVADLTDMTEDERLTNLEENLETYASDHGYTLVNTSGAGKFVLIIHGEGTILLNQMPVSYTGSIATTFAGNMSALPLNRGLTYARAGHVAGLIGRDLTKEEIDSLCNARINPCIRTQKGKRGTPYQVVLATDNTLSTEGSDFWSVTQMRLVTKVLAQVKALGNRTIGTIGYVMLQRQIRDYLTSLVQSGLIRNYTLNIVRDKLDSNKVLVDISLLPYWGVRELFFQVEVGPGV